MVEQLLLHVQRGRSPGGSEYVPDGFGTDIAPTTEDGQPVAAALQRLRRRGDRCTSLTRGSLATARRYHPADPGGHRGPQPTAGNATAGIASCSWPTLRGPGRVVRQARVQPMPRRWPRASGSDPDFEATAPVAVGAGGAEGLMMDVVIAVGASEACGDLLGDGRSPGPVSSVGLATGEPGAALPVRCARGVVHSDPGHCDQCAGVALREGGGMAQRRSWSSTRP